jgi:hypothetical protein
MFFIHTVMHKYCSRYTFTYGGRVEDMPVRIGGNQASSGGGGGGGASSVELHQAALIS